MYDRMRRMLLAGLVVAGLACLPLGAQEAGHKFSSDFVPDWQLQKDYTLEVAKAMPADQYGFKPSEEMRSFGELMLHIGQSTYMFGALAQGVTPPQDKMKFEGEPTKDRIVPYLEGAFDYASAAVSSIDDAKAAEVTEIFNGRFKLSRAKLCELMRNHVTHHRGYALPYLRLKGIKPPEYRFTGRSPSPY